ncbi:hypothetical protein [Leptospira hartskeerlii]|uniref:hypothetical protein n=1 Tax=Leptospira hartskeerlii TaxID=2023177 RepID=UPI0013FD5F91|nr:hypothetical protein [Leptospira hartskeerlii]
MKKLVLALTTLSLVVAFALSAEEKKEAPKKEEAKKEAHKADHKTETKKEAHKADAKK